MTRGTERLDAAVRALLSNRRLAVFDLDGTLYELGPVRRAMALRLAMASLRRGGRRALRVVDRYRRAFEAFSSERAAGFEGPLFARVAAETGTPEPEVRAIVTEWMERRPLDLIRRARIAGAAELFDALRAQGVAIAVWSDHPVSEKLAALGLRADLTASAADPGIAALKPNPAGLRALLDRAGCAADRALMIGDRLDRDGAAAASLGAPFLARSRRPIPGAPWIADFVAAAAFVQGEPRRAGADLDQRAGGMSWSA